VWINAFEALTITPDTFTFDDARGDLFLRFRRTFYRDVVAYEVLGVPDVSRMLVGRVFVPHHAAAVTAAAAPLVSCTWYPAPDNTYAASVIGDYYWRNPSAKGALLTLLENARLLILGEGTPVMEGNPVSGHFQRGASIAHQPKVQAFNPTTQPAVRNWVTYDTRASK
jgi:hypothetical protein